MPLLCLAFVGGVWALQLTPHLLLFSTFYAITYLALSLVLLLASVRLIQKKQFRLKLFSVFLRISAAFILGFLYASTLANSRLSDELSHANEQQAIAVIGVVSSLPVNTERALRLDFDVEKTLTLDVNGKPLHVPRHISLMQYQANFAFSAQENARQTKLSQNQQFHAGQRWQLTVKLKRPHGTYNPHGFDFEAWALSENMRATGTIQSNADNKLLQNFVWQAGYIVERLREKTVHRIQTVLENKPYCAEISALVAGDDSAIHADNWAVYLRTGVNHLMSISGLHITMLAGLAFSAVSFLWRRHLFGKHHYLSQLSLSIPARKVATIAGFIVALAYSLIAGFSIPTQRTFYMLSLLGVALWSGKNISIWRVLPLTLLIVVLIDPWSVNVPGFWLSFGAVAVLAYAVSGNIAQPHWLIASIKTQWAATIGLVPVLILMFGQTSLVSPVANAVAIPLISLLVVPLALLGSFLPIDWALQLAHTIFAGCMAILQYLSSLPYATWQQATPPMWAVTLSLIGVVWLLLPKGIPLRWLGLTLFIPMLLIAPNRPSVGAMQATVLDVGQGLAVVVKTKNHTLLYDTGPKYSAQSDSGSRIIVPFLRGEGIHKLDGIMLSHNDLDHSGGLNSVLAQLPIQWLDSSIPLDTLLGEAVNHQPINLMHCYAGQHWVWDGVMFDVLYPTIASYETNLTDNNRSCVLKISSQYGSLLLTGDIEKEAEASMINADSNLAGDLAVDLASDVMTAPHHGSKTSSTSAFIQAVNPIATIFTAGYLNRFGHPKPIIVARYEANLSEIIKSDTAGAVQVNFAKPNTKNPQKINITQYRQSHPHYWQDAD